MFRLLAILLVVVLSAGCFGQSKATGKYNNQDKPKIADESK